MGEIIAVLSGKGGTGKTTVAVNLAAALEKRENTVLLTDLNIGTYGPDLLLGAEKRAVYHIADVLNGNCKIIQAILDLPGYGQMKYLPAGRTAQPFGVTEDKLKKLFAMFREHFDYVVMDVPTYPADFFFLASKLADRLVFVSDTTETSVRNTVLAKDALDSGAVAGASLVLNRIRKDLVKEDLCDTPEEQIKTISLPLLGIIGESETIYLQAETCEKIVDVKEPSCSAFLRMAGRIMGEKIPFDLKE